MNFSNIIVNQFVIEGGLVGWKWRTPSNPEGDDVFAICERCKEVMEAWRPGRLECPACGLFHEMGE